MIISLTFPIPVPHNVNGTVWRLEHRLRTDQDRAYGPELSLVLPGLPRSGSERPRVISGSTPPGRASWEADGTVGDEIRATAV